MGVVSPLQRERVIDIYGAARNRDLGAVGRDLQRIVNANRSKLPLAAASSFATAFYHEGFIL